MGRASERARMNYYRYPDHVLFYLERHRSEMACARGDLYAKDR